MSALLERIKKNSTIKDTATLSESKFFNKKDMIQTSIPAVNIAFSGQLDGGFTPGLTMWAGPSKHFKTGFSLLMAKSYMDKYPEAVILFYDSEFGTPQSYFNTFGIDISKIVHTPITNIEELKFDIMQQLGSLERTDKVMIIIDSVGNLASKKEVEDALDGKAVADMSRAKQLKSCFRMITPHLTIKDIPMVVVNHTYKEIGLFPKDIVGGGCLVAGSELIMGDGVSLRKIEDILPGEEVLTLLGPKKVTHSWDPQTLAEGTPECFEVTFEDGSSVVCSENHPFLLNGEWVEAKELLVGQEVTKLSV
jgi:RecA/RadA recombinase